MGLRVLRGVGGGVGLTTLTVRDVFISACDVLISALVSHGEITVSVHSKDRECVDVDSQRIRVIVQMERVRGTLRGIFLKEKVGGVVLLDEQDHIAVNTREFVNCRGHLRLFTEQWSRTGGNSIKVMRVLMYREVSPYSTNKSFEEGIPDKEHISSI
jgi:hypothetical protein